MDEPTAAADVAVIQSVERTIRIIEIIKEQDSATLSEITRELDLTKGSVHKHLATLRKNDFIVKDAEQYRLGFRFLDIGGYLRHQFPGSTLIKPKIRELANKTKEVGLFAVEDHGKSVTLFRELGETGVLTQSRVGKSFYLHQVSTGKAILSAMDDEQVHRILDSYGMPTATEDTITREEELFEQLNHIRERGYSVSRSESTPGVRAIGAPVAPQETVVGACAIAGPAHRMDGDRLSEELPDILLSIVNELELNIAHSGTELDFR